MVELKKSRQEGVGLAGADRGYPATTIARNQKEKIKEYEALHETVCVCVCVCVYLLNCT